jgi:hypothetical protein
MDSNEKREGSIDPELLEKLNLLAATPNRDPELVAKGRERFLAELEGLPAARVPESRGWLAGLFGSRNPGGNSVRIFNQKFALSTILALVVVAIMLFGGASATAFASQSSLPGDALYPLKMGLEQTQISLANDAYIQAKLHLEFAQRRMDEITELLRQGRSSDVEFASNEFEYYIQQAMEATQTVMTSDPERGAELSSLVSQALLDYAVALKAVLLEAPDPVKPVVEKALLISQDGAGDEIEVFGVVDSISADEIVIDGEVYLITELTEFEDIIEVGVMVKIHVILTPEGSMIVREIELAEDFDDGMHGFDDDNSNDSVPDENENSNENDNENANDSDENENASEKNSNNDNSEDDETDNESNENGNEDDSDDNMNDNESEEDNEETKSEDNSNENKSEDKDNESNDNESNDNENESEDNDNENDNESDDEEDSNDNGD